MKMQRRPALRAKERTAHAAFRMRLTGCQMKRKMQAQLIRVVPPGNPVPCFKTGTKDVPALYFTEKGEEKMAKEKKLVQSITSRDEDFAQWYTDVVREAKLCD